MTKTSLNIMGLVYITQTRINLKEGILISQKII